MGHNGGFNPYRDQNGEFTTPQGAGKPGRSRKSAGGNGKGYRSNVAARTLSRTDSGAPTGRRQTAAALQARAVAHGDVDGGWVPFTRSLGSITPARGRAVDDRLSREF